MEAITIYANLRNFKVPLKVIKSEDMTVFQQNVLTKHKQLHGTKCVLNQVVCLVNLSKVRLMRIKGKVWDQLADGDSVWVVTTVEWQEYCDKVVENENNFRHGKRIISRHPSSLSYDKFHYFVDQYYVDCFPVDPKDKYAAPPPAQIQNKSPVKIKSPAREESPVTKYKSIFQQNENAPVLRSPLIGSATSAFEMKITSPQSPIVYKPLVPREPRQNNTISGFNQLLTSPEKMNNVEPQVLQIESQQQAIPLQSKNYQDQTPSEEAKIQSTSYRVNIDITPAISSTLDIAEGPEDDDAETEVDSKKLELLQVEPVTADEILKEDQFADGKESQIIESVTEDKEIETNEREDNQSITEIENKMENEKSDKAPEPIIYENNEEGNNENTDHKETIVLTEQVAVENKNDVETTILPGKTNEPLATSVPIISPLRPITPRRNEFVGFYSDDEEEDGSDIVIVNENDVNHETKDAKENASTPIQTEQEQENKNEVYALGADTDSPILEVSLVVSAVHNEPSSTSSNIDSDTDDVMIIEVEMSVEQSSIQNVAIDPIQDKDNNESVPTQNAYDYYKILQEESLPVPLGPNILVIQEESDPENEDTDGIEIIEIINPSSFVQIADPIIQETVEDVVLDTVPQPVIVLEIVDQEQVAVEDPNNNEEEISSVATEKTEVIYDEIIPILINNDEDMIEEVLVIHQNEVEEPIMDAPRVDEGNDSSIPEVVDIFPEENSISCIQIDDDVEEQHQLQDADPSDSSSSDEEYDNRSTYSTSSSSLLDDSRAAVSPDRSNINRSRQWSKTKAGRDYLNNVEMIDDGLVRRLEESMTLDGDDDMDPLRTGCLSIEEIAASEHPKVSFSQASEDENELDLDILEVARSGNDKSGAEDEEISQLSSSLSHDAIMDEYPSSALPSIVDEVNTELLQQSQYALATVESRLETTSPKRQVVTPAPPHPTAAVTSPAHIFQAITPSSGTKFPQQLEIKSRIIDSPHVPSGTSSMGVTSPQDSSMILKLKEQANELAEINRAKTALEARLEETRYLLQMFAGMPRPFNDTSNPAAAAAALLAGISPSNPKDMIRKAHETNKIIDDLEDTIRDVVVETIAEQSIVRARERGARLSASGSNDYTSPHTLKSALKTTTHGASPDTNSSSSVSQEKKKLNRSPYQRRPSPLLRKRSVPGGRHQSPNNEEHGLVNSNSIQQSRHSPPNFHPTVSFFHGNNNSNNNNSNNNSRKPVPQEIDPESDEHSSTTTSFEMNDQIHLKMGNTVVRNWKRVHPGLNNETKLIHHPAATTALHASKYPTVVVVDDNSSSSSLVPIHTQNRLPQNEMKDSGKEEIELDQVIEASKEPDDEYANVMNDIEVANDLQFVETIVDRINDALSHPPSNNINRSEEVFNDISELSNEFSSEDLHTAVVENLIEPSDEIVVTELPIVQDTETIMPVLGDENEFEEIQVHEPEIETVDIKNSTEPEPVHDEEIIQQVDMVLDQFAYQSTDENDLSSVDKEFFNSNFAVDNSEESSEDFELSSQDTHSKHSTHVSSDSSVLETDGVEDFNKIEETFPKDFIEDIIEPHNDELIHTSNKFDEDPIETIPMDSIHDDDHFLNSAVDNEGEELLLSMMVVVDNTNIANGDDTIETVPEISELDSRDDSNSLGNMDEVAEVINELQNVERETEEEITKIVNDQIHNIDQNVSDIMNNILTDIQSASERTTMLNEDEDMKELVTSHNITENDQVDTLVEAVISNIDVGTEVMTEEIIPEIVEDIATLTAPIPHDVKTEKESTDKISNEPVENSTSIEQISSTESVEVIELKVEEKQTDNATKSTSLLKKIELLRKRRNTKSQTALSRAAANATATENSIKDVEENILQMEEIVPYPAVEVAEVNSNVPHNMDHNVFDSLELQSLPIPVDIPNISENTVLHAVDAVGTEVEVVDEILPTYEFDGSNNLDTNTTNAVADLNQVDAGIETANHNMETNHVNPIDSKPSTEVEESNHDIVIDFVPIVEDVTVGKFDDHSTTFSNAMDDSVVDSEALSHVMLSENNDEASSHQGILESETNYIPILRSSSNLYAEGMDATSDNMSQSEVHYADDLTVNTLPTHTSFKSFDSDSQIAVRSINEHVELPKEGVAAGIAEENLMTESPQIVHSVVLDNDENIAENLELSENATISVADNSVIPLQPTEINSQGTVDDACLDVKNEAVIDEVRVIENNEEDQVPTISVSIIMNSESDTDVSVTIEELIIEPLKEVPQEQEQEVKQKQLVEEVAKIQTPMIEEEDVDKELQEVNALFGNILPPVGGFISPTVDDSISPLTMLECGNSVATGMNLNNSPPSSPAPELLQSLTEKQNNPTATFIPVVTQAVTSEHKMNDMVSLEAKLSVSVPQAVLKQDENRRESITSGVHSEAYSSIVEITDEYQSTVPSQTNTLASPKGLIPPAEQLFSSNESILHAQDISKEDAATSSKSNNNNPYPSRTERKPNEKDEITTTVPAIAASSDGMDDLVLSPSGKPSRATISSDYDDSKLFTLSTDPILATPINTRERKQLHIDTTTNEIAMLSTPPQTTDGNIQDGTNNEDDLVTSPLSSLSSPTMMSSPEEEEEEEMSPPPPPPRIPPPMMDSDLDSAGYHQDAKSTVSSSMAAVSHTLSPTSSRLELLRQKLASQTAKLTLSVSQSSQYSQSQTSQSQAPSHAPSQAPSQALSGTTSHPIPLAQPSMLSPRQTIDAHILTSPLSPKSPLSQSSISGLSFSQSPSHHNPLSPSRPSILPDETPLITVHPREGELSLHSKLTEPYKAMYHYFLPFFLTAKYQDDLRLRGTRAREQIISILTPEEILFWVVFQHFGTPDGIIVKQIKSTQVSRLFQDTRLINMAATQIDFQLVKIYAKLNGTQVVKVGSKPMGGHHSAGLMMMITPPKVVSKTGTLVKATEQTKGKNGGLKTDPTSLNTATFAAFVELLKSFSTLSFNGLNKMTTSHKATSGGSSSSSTGRQPSDCTVDQIVQQFISYFNKEEFMYYHRYSLEYKISISGVLTRSIYTQYLRQFSFPITATQVHDYSLPDYPELITDLVRQIWERNAEQIRQIYSFYATTVETRRVGSGPLKLLLSLENCKEFLQDFQLVPQLMDVQTFLRMYRSCKLWEWEVAEAVIQAKLHLNKTSSQSHLHDEQSTLDTKSVPSTFSTLTGHRNTIGTGAGTVAGTVAGNTAMTDHYDPQDPFDFKGCVGHYSLSLWGFMELITRIACFNQRLGNTPTIALENAMHLMDASPGKGKLINASRKSISVRHFVYANKR